MPQPSGPARIAITTVILGLAFLTAAVATPVIAQTGPPRDTPFPAPPDTTPPDQTATISGRVMNGQTGQALPRARVVARPRDATGQRQTVQTDRSGRYVLSGLTPGRYTLTVSRPGFVALAYGQRRPRQPSTPIDVQAGEHLQHLDVILPPGSVITGTVVDEDGVALPLATVRVMRYIYQQGQPQLVAAGSDRTDDRGRYRIFALEPGDYYVNASAPRQLVNTPGAGRFPPSGPGPRGDFRVAPGGDDGNTRSSVAAQPPGSSAPLGYAPTYYPGSTRVADAAQVSVSLSSEVGGIDFAVRLVPTATVGGEVLGPDGTAANGVQVMLIPDDGVLTRDSILSSRVRRGGTFEIRNVPPGLYTLRAVSRRGRRGGDGPGGGPLFASQRIAIDGVDVPNATLLLSPGTTLTGTATFEATGPSPPGLGSIRVSARAVRTIPLLRDPEGRLADDGTFLIESVPGGPRLIRPDGVPSGWTLKAVYLDGHDVIDTPLEFAGVARVDGIRLVFTDQVSLISGLVEDHEGQPSTDFTVIAYPIDDAEWTPRSRRIKASRPDQNGRYELEGLPAGSYFLAAVDAVQQGEWFDPRFLRRLRPASVRLSITEGESIDMSLALEPR